MKERDLKESYGLHLRLGFLLAIVLIITGFLSFPSYNLNPYIPKVEAVPDTLFILDEVLPPEAAPPPMPRPAVPEEARVEEEVEVATIPSVESLFRVPRQTFRAPPPDSFIPYDEPPAPIKVVKPVYPEIAKIAGVQGTVTLHILIDTEGRVRDVRVIEPLNEACDSSAVQAVRQFFFSPARQNDKPVTVWASYSVDFRLRR